MSKSELRKDVINARAGLPAAAVAEKSARILERIKALGEYRQSKVFMVYVDFRNEVQTGFLIKEFMAGGKVVTVPVTDIANRRLTPSRLEDYPGDLVPGAWGILEPRPECLRPMEPVLLDLVIVPGVAFDEAGNRLGYGGGFYDRFLPRTRPGTIYLAPAFEMQIRADVYPGAHDCPVHILVTEDRVIHTGATGYGC